MDAFCSNIVLCTVELSLQGELGRLTVAKGPFEVVTVACGGLNKDVDGAGPGAGGGGGGGMFVWEGDSIRHLLEGCNDGESEGGLKTGGLGPAPG